MARTIAADIPRPVHQVALGDVEHAQDANSGLRLRTKRANRPRDGRDDNTCPNRSGPREEMNSPQIGEISYSQRRSTAVGLNLDLGGLAMDRRDGGHGRTETDDMVQVLECRVKAASKLDEILDLLQDPSRVEAMMGRYDDFVSGRLPVTVLDSRADGPTTDDGTRGCRRWSEA